MKFFFRPLLSWVIYPDTIGHLLFQPLRKEAAMAELVATEAGCRVVDRCMQLFVGLRVAKDLPFERWFRVMRIRCIGEGPSEVQRPIIARA